MLFADTSGELNPGGRVRSVARVANGGHLESKNVTVHFFLCPRRDANGCIALEDGIIPRLGPNSTESLYSDFLSLPPNIMQGAVFLRAVVDMADQLDEKAEQNNEFFKPLTIGVPMSAASYRSYANLRLNNTPAKVLSGVTREGCVNACSRETSFICKSVDFTPAEGSCRLQGESESPVQTRRRAGDW